jgi:molybdate transport system ATP-binding protein
VNGASSSLHARVVASRGAFALDVDLDVAPGTTLALLGPNGAGKSTAIAALAGLVPLGGGSGGTGLVSLGSRVLEDAASGEFVASEKRRIGVVFQDYLLFPHLSVLENVAFGLRANGIPKKEARDAAHSWLERFSIAELSSRRPAELSGGQAQRVALARAVAPEPELLLLDEPLAALDAQVRDDIREELASHLQSFAGPSIVVTHSFDDVAALASEVVVLEGGRVTQRGTVREVVGAPATAYVDKLVSDWAAD